MLGDSQGGPDLFRSQAAEKGEAKVLAAIVASL